MMLEVKESKHFITTLKNSSKSSILVVYEGLSGKKYQFMVTLMDFNEKEPQVLITIFWDTENVLSFIHKVGQPLDYAELASRIAINQLVAKDLYEGLKMFEVHGNGEVKSIV